MVVAVGSPTLAAASPAADRVSGMECGVTPRTWPPKSPDRSFYPANNGVHDGHECMKGESQSELLEDSILCPLRALPSRV